jgi:hypothetical protein
MSSIQNNIYKPEKKVFLTATARGAADAEVSVVRNKLKTTFLEIPVNRNFFYLLACLAVAV